MEFLDLRTILIVNGTLGLFMALSLYAYGAEQKTYDGHKVWTHASFLIALTYFALLFMSFSPGLTVTALAVGFPLHASAMRVDAVNRFLNGKPSSKAWYFITPPVVAVCLADQVLRDDLMFRTFLLSAGIAVLILAMGFKVARKATRETRVFNVFVGACALVASSFLMVRAVHWLLNPSITFLTGGPLHSVAFMVTALMDTLASALFIMLQARRTTTELEAAMREIKTLKGIIPFCSYCSKIRDKDGVWEQPDMYIYKHSSADVSHGICPECRDKFFPGLGGGK